MATKKVDPILYSQHLDFAKPAWRKSGCAIASLGMIMALQKPKKKINLAEIYERGLDKEAYLKGVGWRHQGLAQLAKSYGFKEAKAFDLAAKDLAAAMRKLKQELKNGPVMVSVFSKYIVGRNGHLVVLLGLTDESALVLDPDTRSRLKIAREIPLATFWPAWKKRFIVIK